MLVLLVPLADLSEHSLLLQLNWIPSWCRLCYAQLELFLEFDVIVDYLHLRGFGIKIGDVCTDHEEAGSSSSD